MPSIAVGQKVLVDLFGLQLPGQRFLGEGDTGTVVALDWGTITVRLDTNPEAEVTVSPHRVLAGGF